MGQQGPGTVASGVGGGVIITGPPHPDPLLSNDHMCSGPLALHMCLVAQLFSEDQYLVDTSPESAHIYSLSSCTSSIIPSRVHLCRLYDHIDMAAREITWENVLGGVQLRNGERLVGRGPVRGDVGAMPLWR